MAEKLRLDKWLWHGRFYKTRSLAAARIDAGDVRVNGTRTEKRSHMVSAGDVLTFALGATVRVIRIDALGTRRGPASEAQALYTDLAPPDAPRGKAAPENPSYEGKGRPTKRDRRALDLSRARSLE